MLSFDLGQHKYLRHSLNLLSHIFGPDRIRLILGDSGETVPRFLSDNPGFEGICDVIFIDGDHTDEGALKDMVNFSKYANLGNNIVIVDDYDNLDVKRAWNVAVGEIGLITELNVIESDCVDEYEVVGGAVEGLGRLVPSKVREGQGGSMVIGTYTRRIDDEY